MTDASSGPRLSVDIGGTFTDVVLEHGGQQTTAKVLTTPSAPDKGVMDGVGRALEESGVAASEIALLIHGTTLASVVPWISSAISEAATPDSSNARPTPSITPLSGAEGVVSTFAVVC